MDRLAEIYAVSDLPGQAYARRRPTIVRWRDLTSDQQCVLLNAVEDTYLFAVLTECAQGADWPDLMPQVPHLARIVEDMAERGWVVLTRDSEEEGELPIDIPADQVHEILSDPANWWSPDGVRPIAVAATEKGLAVYRSTSFSSSEADHEPGPNDRAVD